MSTPLLIGLAVGGSALVLRYTLRIAQGLKAQNAATPRITGYVSRVMKFNPFGPKEWVRGGFEATMTKKEAGLIPGVREGSSPDKIRKAYMNLININHPDRGGSSYIAGKVNEAKDMLLKGK